MSLILPLARVRKTVKLDPGVGNISKEGLSVMTKATEVFMTMLAQKSWLLGRQVRGVCFFGALCFECARGGGGNVEGDEC